MENENLLRPNKLDDFFGQDFIVSNLKVFIFSAKKRKTVLNHLLFYGPPGLGKTSLANVIANEMNANIKIMPAPLGFPLDNLPSTAKSLPSSAGSLSINSFNPNAVSKNVTTAPHIIMMFG